MVIIGPSEGIVRSLQGHWGGGGPSGRYEWEAPWASVLHAVAFDKPCKLWWAKKEAKRDNTGLAAGWVSAVAWQWECGKFRQKAGLPWLVGGWGKELSGRSLRTPHLCAGEEFVSRGGAGERGSRAKRAEVGPVSRATQRTDWPLGGSLCLNQAKRVMLSPACLYNLQWRTKACGLG